MTTRLIWFGSCFAAQVMVIEDVRDIAVAPPGDPNKLSSVVDKVKLALQRAGELMQSARGLIVGSTI